MPLPQDDTQLATVRSLQDVALTNSDTLNPGGVAEGSQVAPSQHGAYRVPVPTGFKVVSSTYQPATLTTVFVLAWNDVNDPADGLNQCVVAGYKIYAKLAISNNPNPTLVGESPASPCYANVISPTAASQVTFFVQPYLSSGQTLPITACPSCTGATTTPFYEFSFGGVNVFITSGVPIGGGGTSTALAVQSGSFQTVIAAGFAVAFNQTTPSQRRTWSWGFTGGGAGVGLVYNGTETGGISGVGDVIRLDGGNGRITSVVAPGGFAFVAKDTGGSELDIVPNSAFTATAGAATLPANPLGFFVWSWGGSIAKVPYYAN